MTPISRPSPNFDERRHPISMVVLHYTGMQSATAALDRLTDPAAKVSSHWVVAEDGQVVALVNESRRAWHAGKSWWRGISDVNSASIGIEIVNPGHEFGYRPFPAPQMDSVQSLVAAANAAVRRITPEDARAMMAASNPLLVDVRDPGEVAQSGMLAGAVNVSRGMLEFRADPEMPSHDTAFDRRRPVIVYCASGGRAALAGKALLDLGYENVSNLGAFNDAITAGLPMEPA